MAFSITGKIKVLGDTQQVKDTFRKRDFVLTDDSSNYPQQISFQLVQDNCDLMNGMHIGDEVSVMFDVRGREWTSPSGEVKYFNSLNAWKVERQNATNPGAPASAPAAMDTPPLAPADEDDLPF